MKKPQRARRRLVIVLLIYFSLFAYLALSFCGLHPASWLLILVPFALILWMPLVYWRQDEPRSDWRTRLGVWASYASMGFLSLLLLCVLARDLSAFALWLSGRDAAFLYSGPTRGRLLLLTLALFVLGVFSAFFGVRVRKVRVAIRDLPPQFAGFRLAQLSDLHIGPTIQKQFVARVIRKTNAAAPDAIAITGDLVDGLVPELSRFTILLKELRAPSGIFYVTGNHEYYWDGPGWIAEMKRYGFRVLENESALITRPDSSRPLAIIGVNDVSARSDLPAALSAVPANAVKVLLCHQPSRALQAAELGVDLQLSGHTHGGQFIPWTWVVRVVHTYHQGLFRVADRMWIYVNPGTGHWGPPLRLGARPEVTLLELVPFQ